MKKTAWLCCAGLLGFGCVAIPAPGEELTSQDALDGSTIEPLELDGGPPRPPIGSGHDATSCAAQEASVPAAERPIADGGMGIAEEHAADGGADAPDASVTEHAMLASPARFGDLVITELMIDPKARRDDDAEWIELWNPSDEQPLDLASCVLDDGGSARRSLAGLVVPAGGLVTIARSDDPGFVPDLVLALSLGNSADTVAVICDGAEIDRVRYDAAFPLRTGASLALDPDAATAAANDAADAWCVAVDAYATDLGTPGAPNPSCDPGAEDDAGVP